MQLQVSVLDVQERNLGAQHHVTSHPRAVLRMCEVQQVVGLTKCLKIRRKGDGV